MFVRFFVFLWESFVDFVALVFPVNCVSCGFFDSLLCFSCCKYLFSVLSIPGGLRRSGVFLSFPVWSCSEYDDNISRVVVAYKDKSLDGLAQPLGEVMSVVLEDLLEVVFGQALFFEKKVLLVPVPSTRKSFRLRGYEPVFLLADRIKFCSSYAGVLEVVAPLFFVKDVADQSTLGGLDRKLNLNNSMGVSGVGGGRVCVLVDDVMTTGATLAEAARVLELAGFRVCAALTLSFSL